MASHGEHQKASRRGGVTRTVNAGFGHHLAGRLDRAEVLYRKALEKDPEHAEALHFLGVIACQNGNFKAAIELIQRALPELQDLPEAHLNLGNALWEAGRLAEAADRYRQAIALDPDYGMAHSNLARALNDQGLFEAGLQSSGRAIELIPDFAGAHINHAAALMGLARIAEAEVPLRRALKLIPDRAETHNNLGRVLAALGRLDEAVVSYWRAVDLQPNDPEAHFNLGNAFNDQHRFDEAVECYRRALEVTPKLAEVHYKLGGAFHNLGRFEEALRSYNNTLALKPGSASAMHNRGVALGMLGRFEEALESYDRALALRPGWVNAVCNRGAALHELGRLDEALESYESALALDPGLADPHYCHSLLLLLRGDFTQGWAEHEWRLRRKDGGQDRGDFGRPRWSGERLEGKTILLHAEQGLGDTLQFVRFVPVLAARGARVMLAAPKQLFALLQAADLATAFEGPELPHFDFHLPLLSAPHVLGTTEETIPAGVPYLSAEPARIASWQERLPGEGLKVGIAWQGNPDMRVDRGRSIPLRSFAPIAALPSVRLVSLQKNDGLDQLDALPDGMKVGTLDPDFDVVPDGFLDTAAVMMNLDLVISADTAVAHLAGALGRPVWIALKHVPDWRWMLDREDSPWYPTARLFRQRRPGDWDELFERMAAELARVISGEPDRLLPERGLLATEGEADRVVRAGAGVRAATADSPAPQRQYRTQ